MNALAFGINVVSVSLPGRLDGSEEEWKKGQEQKDKNADDDDIFAKIHGSRAKQLINPSGWAFAIWGPIYLGEMAFVSSGQFFSPAVKELLPQITAPFVAANLFQSLWCASFRPKYHKSKWWHKYISAAMLGGTTYYLSRVHSVVMESPNLSSLWFVPITMHFGWCTAATLLNINGAVALDSLPDKDSLVIAVGHFSASAAATIGSVVTLLTNSPVYGATVAWALAACKDGMKKRLKDKEPGTSDALVASSRIQEKLCFIGSLICAMASIYTGVFGTRA